MRWWTAVVGNPGAMRKDGMRIHVELKYLLLQLQTSRSTVLSPVTLELNLPQSPSLHDEACL